MMKTRCNASTLPLSRILFFGLLLIVGVDGKKLAKVTTGTKYSAGQDVHVVVNKVGPYNNPTETYRYYSLPFCEEHKAHEDVASAKKGAQKHRQRLGEQMVGDRKESSPYAVKFKESLDTPRTLCEITLTTEDMNLFTDAIRHSYFFEMLIEDLPMWGYIGDIIDDTLIVGEAAGTEKIVLFPHLHFVIGTNKDNIVSTSVNTDISQAVDITDTSKPKTIQFSYSVEFIDEKIEWKQRMKIYSHSSFAPYVTEIHWLSIVNSFVLVLLLTAFLAIILMRVLKNDISRYMDIEDNTMEEEESGWKLIHGDVFRFPQYSTLFCAAVGTGTQLLVTTFLVLALSLGGFLSTTRRGSILAGSVVIYSITSMLGGYTSTSLYLQMNGKMWARCIILICILFPVPVTCVFCWANSVAFLHGSTSAMPVSTVLAILALYIFVSTPLTLLGGILAKNFGKKDFNAPTRTTKVAREIPSEIPWYKGRFVQMLISGFLPFSAIFIELHYIFASMWGHQIYTLFGILFIAFILLTIVTSSITVALVYFQLAREDHRWWWVAFNNGGMIGIAIYLYSFYYYFQRSGMNGILQASFFFGYMAIVSFAFFLMLGSAGFRLSLVFVKYIYGRVKCD